MKRIPSLVPVTLHNFIRPDQAAYGLLYSKLKSRYHGYAHVTYLPSALHYMQLISILNVSKMGVRDIHMFLKWFKETLVSVNVEKCCIMKVSSKGRKNKPCLRLL